MIKRILPFLLSLFLIFSLNAAIVNADDNLTEAEPSAPQEMPAQGGGRRGGFGNGNMGMPPSGDMGGNTAPAEEQALPQSNQPVPETDSAPVKNDTESTTQEGVSEQNAATENNPGNFPENGMRPGGMNNFNGMTQENTQTEQVQSPTGFWGFIKYYSTPVVSVILLIFAFIFVVFYKRRMY